MDRIENLLAKVVDELEFLSLEKRATQHVNSDSDLLGLPWAAPEDVTRGLDSVEKIKALQRILQSPMVASSHTRYVGDALGVLMTPDFKGCFYNGLAKG